MTRDERCRKSLRWRVKYIPNRRMKMTILGLLHWKVYIRRTIEKVESFCMYVFRDLNKVVVSLTHSPPASTAVRSLLVRSSLCLPTILYLEVSPLKGFRHLRVSSSHRAMSGRDAVSLFKLSYSRWAFSEVRLVWDDRMKILNLIGIYWIPLPKVAQRRFWSPWKSHNLPLIYVNFPGLEFQSDWKWSPSPFVLQSRLHHVILRQMLLLIMTTTHIRRAERKSANV